MSTSEEIKALHSAEETMRPSETIFGKIVKKEIPANILYEDDKCLAFHDISPQAPTHIILIPKERDELFKLSDAEDRHKGILGDLMVAVSKIAKQEKLGDFRVVINNGPHACQSVFHLHLHILAGRSFKWPPG